MGVGVWSMHFIGMLAFKLPIDLGYDLAITAVVAVDRQCCPAALPCGWSASRSYRPGNWRFGALVMGAGISAMHYTGMAAMRMQPGIDYDPTLFSASLLIAVGASAAALWIAFRLRQHAPYVRLIRGWRGGDHGHCHRRHALHRHGCCAISRWQFLRCSGSTA